MKAKHICIFIVMYSLGTCLCGKHMLLTVNEQHKDPRGKSVLDCCEDKYVHIYCLRHCMSLEEPKLHDGLCKTFEKQIKDCQKLIKEHFTIGYNTNPPEIPTIDNNYPNLGLPKLTGEDDAAVQPQHRLQDETTTEDTPVSNFKSAFSKCEEQHLLCKTDEDCEGNCSWCWSDDNQKDKPSFCAPPWDLLPGLKRETRLDKDSRETGPESLESISANVLDDEDRADSDESSMYTYEESSGLEAGPFWRTRQRNGARLGKYTVPQNGFPVDKEQQPSRLKNRNEIMGLGMISNIRPERPNMDDVRGHFDKLTSAELEQDVGDSISLGDENDAPWPKRYYEENEKMVENYNDKIKRLCPELFCDPNEENCKPPTDVHRQECNRKLKAMYVKFKKIDNSQNDDDEANNFNAYGDKHQPYLDVDRRAYDPVVEPQQLVTIEPVEAAERFKSGLEQLEELVKSDFWPGNTSEIAGLRQLGRNTGCGRNTTQTDQESNNSVENVTTNLPIPMKNSIKTQPTVINKNSNYAPLNFPQGRDTSRNFPIRHGEGRVGLKSLSEEDFEDDTDSKRSAKEKIVKMIKGSAFIPEEEENPGDTFWENKPRTEDEEEEEEEHEEEEEEEEEEYEDEDDEEEEEPAGEDDEEEEEEELQSSEVNTKGGKSKKDYKKERSTNEDIKQEDDKESERVQGEKDLVENKDNDGGNSFVAISNTQNGGQRKYYQRGKKGGGKTAQRFMQDLHRDLHKIDNGRNGNRNLPSKRNKSRDIDITGGSQKFKGKACMDTKPWCKNVKPPCLEQAMAKHCPDTCGNCQKGRNIFASSVKDEASEEVEDDTQLSRSKPTDISGTKIEKEYAGKKGKTMDYLFREDGGSIEWEKEDDEVQPIADAVKKDKNDHVEKVFRKMRFKLHKKNIELPPKKTIKLNDLVSAEKVKGMDLSESLLGNVMSQLLTSNDQPIIKKDQVNSTVLDKKDNVRTSMSPTTITNISSTEKRNNVWNEDHSNVIGTRSNDDDILTSNQISMKTTNNSLHPKSKVSNEDILTMTKTSNTTNSLHPKIKVSVRNPAGGNNSNSVGIELQNEEDKEGNVLRVTSRSNNPTNDDNILSIPKMDAKKNMIEKTTPKSIAHINNAPKTTQENLAMNVMGKSIAVLKATTTTATTTTSSTNSNKSDDAENVINVPISHSTRVFNGFTLINKFKASTNEQQGTQSITTLSTTRKEVGNKLRKKLPFNLLRKHTGKKVSSYLRSSSEQSDMNKNVTTGKSSIKPVTIAKSTTTTTKVSVSPTKPTRKNLLNLLKRRNEKETRLPTMNNTIKHKTIFF